MTAATLQTMRGVLLGATVGSLLMLGGWTVRDRYPIVAPCRDSFRRILPDTEGINCATPGQTMLFVDLGGKPGVICQCAPPPAPRVGMTELI